MATKKDDKKIGDTLREEDADGGDESLSFSPETLNDVADEIGMILTGYQTNIDDAAATPVAEAHYNMCLALLEQARCQAKLATYAQSRAIADIRLGG